MIIVGELWCLFTINDDAAPLMIDHNSRWLVKTNDGPQRLIYLDDVSRFNIIEGPSCWGINNWHEMTELEQSNTLRLLGKRNKLRCKDPCIWVTWCRWWNSWSMLSNKWWEINGWSSPLFWRNHFKSETAIAARSLKESTEKAGFLNKW